jgi:alpha-1,3-glucosyltransferase
MKYHPTANKNNNNNNNNNNSTANLSNLFQYYSSPDLYLLVVLSLLKLSLIPFYHSTDFQVHRNWLAITANLPVNQWYYSSISEWTLDYPPFFAWFEYFLSLPAQHIDSNMLSLTQVNYTSNATLYYQRITVILSDILLYYSIRYYINISISSINKSQQLLYNFTQFFLLFASYGLLVVDHIHFQYNGLLFALLIYSIAAMKSGQLLLSGVFFAILLNFKHIFLYIAPVYFIFLLKNYCLKAPTALAKVRQLLKLGVSVIFIFGLSLGPFIYYDQLLQLKNRLFPFQRGLSHAYWASNIWCVKFFFTDLFLTAQHFHLLTLWS